MLTSNRRELIHLNDRYAAYDYKKYNFALLHDATGDFKNNDFTASIRNQQQYQYNDNQNFKPLQLQSGTIFKQIRKINPNSTCPRRHPPEQYHVGHSQKMTLDKEWLSNFKCVKPVFRQSFWKPLYSEQYTKNNELDINGALSWL